MSVQTMTTFQAAQPDAVSPTVSSAGPDSNGTRLAVSTVVTEQLVCPCCASPAVEVLSIQCNDCGVVVIKAPQDRSDQFPAIRQKPDRRRTPRP
jgi:hypothetical protein